MTVMHICNGYFDTRLYQTLFENLKEQGVLNQVFVPTKISNEKKVKTEAIIEAQCFSNADRVFFYKKQKKVYSKFLEVLEENSFDIIHAHTVFSNGFIAYKYYKQYGTPYIVAVRNTDINIFFKYMFFLRSVGIEILLNAEKIIFLGPEYKNILVNKYIPKSSTKKILEKSEIIPNGIDRFWLENIAKRKDIKTEKINILVVGAINKNKNAICVVQAASILNKKGYKVKVTIIGEVEDKRYCDKLKADFVNILPPMEKEKLIDYYRKADLFVLPSKTETFGLVYAEALSQGVPIIYSQYQGFDGQFAESEVGFHAKSDSVIEIVEAIEKIIYDYKEISIRCIEGCKKFDWMDISKRYTNIYNKILKYNYEKEN